MFNLGLSTYESPFVLEYQRKNSKLHTFMLEYQRKYFKLHNLWLPILNPSISNLPLKTAFLHSA